MTAEIFKPLGMDSTTVFDDAQRLIKNRAYGYTKTKKGFEVSHSDFVMTGDGCVMTTLEDFVKWDAALRDGKLVKPETLKQAFTSGALDDGTAHDYGFGWMIGKHLKRTLLSHSGGWAGASTYIGRYVDDGVTVVVLSNLESMATGMLGNRIAREYFKDEKDE